MNLRDLMMISGKIVAVWSLGLAAGNATTFASERVMPLRVHCPSGCLIRVPTNRAGKVVRCPECKQTIRLGKVTRTEIESGKPIPIHGEVVEHSEKAPEAPLTELPSFDATSKLIDPIELPDLIESPELTASKFRKKSKSSRSKLLVPDSIKPPSIRRNAERKKSDGNSVSSSPKKAAPKPVSPALPSIRLDSQPEVGADGSEIPSITDAMRTTSGIKRRVHTATADRVMISKFFAICLCVVAAINLAPAVYYWIQWSRTFESDALPRWIYLQAFLAALHVIYAVYLAQIKDWSALKTVAIAMLAVAVVFGAVSTGLLTGGGQGVIAKFLEIPHVLISQASIWCVAMLCLATMMCYIGGKVAVNWQRTEQLLREIVS